MCGLIGYSGVVEKADLHAALSSLHHRGPDDFGVYFDRGAGVALGHTRLSILELSSRGHQPMVSEDGKVVIVFNGEIYNFRELRSELESLGSVFIGSSDTEVLLRLYLVEGELALRRLNGVFAFAIWDSRSESLLVARDGMGVKPLYFSETATGFCFSSEIKALATLTPFAPELDYESIDRYLTFLWCPGDGTPIKSVRKLGPGEAIWVQRGKIIKHFSWYKLPIYKKKRAALTSEEYIKKTAEILRTSVQRQLTADVPVGAFLSGGLDSSSVVAFAREQHPNICCFTIETIGDAEDGVAGDLPYARKVAEHLKVPLEVVPIDSDRMAEDLEEMVAQLDEPLADPAPLNVLYISRRAREHGIKVLLSGAGGDDLFTGYRRHQAIMWDEYWTRLPRSLRASLEKASALLDQRGTFGRRLKKFFNGASLDGNERIVNYFVWSRRQDLVALYSDDFKAALAKTEVSRPMLDFLSTLPSGVSKIDRMLALEQKFFLADHNLMYTDKMSMAAGVEVRVPFLDLDLVEFAHDIPAHLKQHRCEGKWVLKKAMEPYLPNAVIYRPKTGFGVPLRRWMRFELRELLGDLLSERNLRERGLFDPIAVHRLMSANDNGKVDAGYTLLSLLCVELWCRRFIDKSNVVQ
jgi:asparagine synthase (glutamine-hydrolysing)